MSQNPHQAAAKAARLREMKVVAQLRLAERSIGQIARQMGIPVATAALWSQIGHAEEI